MVVVQIALAAILLVSDVRSEKGESVEQCLFGHCSEPLQKCWQNQACHDSLVCTGACDFSTTPDCADTCNLFKDELMTELMQCQANHHCFPKTEIGKCLVQDNQTVDEFLMQEMANSSWYILKGTTGKAIFVVLKI